MMVVKTRLISEQDDEVFEQHLDAFLETREDGKFELIDIKFSTAICTDGLNYAALIIYKIDII